MGEERAMHKIIAACLIFLVVRLTAQADVSIRANGACGQNCTMYKVALSGTIDDAMFEQFKEAADDHRVVATSRYLGPIVTLNSPGGSVPAAMRIGDVIRQHGYFTEVYDGEECSSACVLVLSAGVERIARFGKVGLHRPRFDEEKFANLTLKEANKRYNEMSSSVEYYLQRMGLPEALYERMMKVSSDKIDYLRPVEIRGFGLDGEDAAWSEWRRAKGIQTQGKENYEVNQRYFEVLEKCSNEPHKDPDSCEREISPDFKRQLEQCSASGVDRIRCAQAISDRMLRRYP
jgi:ATP-dependent protease ClpP protease subunit